MTPQEKATELVKKYKDYSLHHNLLEKCIENAKQCALIAVEEIKNVTAPYCDRHEDYYQKLKETEKQEYWNEVKSEIEKL